MNQTAYLSRMTLVALLALVIVNGSLLGFLALKLFGNI